MKKIIFLISLLFVSAVFAQEAQEAENAGETAESAREEPETAPAKADDDKITISREELAKLVREAVAEEMAKKEAEKKETETQKEQEVAENAAQPDEKPAGEAEAKDENKPKPTNTGDTNGLIQSSYTKSSIAFIMGDDNLRDNSQYSPKWALIALSAISVACCVSPSND